MNEPVEVKAAREWVSQWARERAHQAQLTATPMPAASGESEMNALLAAYEAVVEALEGITVGSICSLRGKNYCLTHNERLRGDKCPMRVAQDIIGAIAQPKSGEPTQ